MVTKYAPDGYQSTVDHISWALITAPGFKGKFTLNEIFEDLSHGLNSIRQRTRSPAKLEVLVQCEEKLAESKAAFTASEMKPAHHALQKAGELLRSLMRK